MERSKFKWCSEVIEQIRFKPDRGKIWNELMNHIEDHVEAMIGQGYTEKEAETKAVETMGDPMEVGKQLDAVHKPWLGWLWRISKWLVVLMLVAAVVASVWFSLEGKHYLFWDEADAHFAETVLEEEKLVRRWQLNVSDRSDGYTFTIDEAALWEDNGGCTLYLNLRVTTLLPPWSLSLDALRDFALVDDQGDAYAWYGGAGTKTLRSLGMYLDNVFVIEIPGFDPNVRWLQFYYTRAGRNIILPIDLMGGEGA